MPDPFLVMATQNPIESEGTYPLPEAQVDRFMLKILIGYPAHDEELTIVQRQLDAPPELRETLSLDELAAAPARRRSTSTSTRRSSATPSTLATRRATRRAHGLAELAQYIAYGASPRGPISLIQAARALALIRGRDYVIVEDVHALAKDALRHRLVLTYQALAEEVTADTILDSVLAAVPVPQLDLARPSAAVSSAARSSADRRSGPAPGRCRTGCCARSTSTIGRRMQGLLAGDYRSSLLGDGTRARACPAVRRRATTSAGSTGTSPRARASRTCACSIAERVLVTWLLLDTSPSMHFGTADRRKADVAEGVAIAVGHVATRRGNRLGVLTFGGAEIRARCRRARAGVGLLGLLAALRERAGATEQVGATSLGDALRRTGALARQRALVVVVSDFRGPRDWREPLLELAGRHDVLAVEIRDPREQELPNVGELWLVDPETGRQLRVDTRSAKLRAAVRGGRRRRAARASRARSRRSASGTPCSRPPGDWLRPLAAFLRRRARELPARRSSLLGCSRAAGARRRCTCSRERRRERARGALGDARRCCRTWSTARPGAPRTCRSRSCSSRSRR